jgi:hypothetical protein
MSKMSVQDEEDAAFQSGSLVKQVMKRKISAAVSF